MKNVVKSMMALMALVDFVLVYVHIVFQVLIEAYSLDRKQLNQFQNSIYIYVQNVINFFMVKEQLQIYYAIAVNL